MNFKKTILAAAFAVLAPVAAFAVPVSGQLDISGLADVGNSDFSATGNVDLLDPGFVVQATGDFATTISQLDAVALTDVDFTAPGVIWEVGGFTFTATSYFGIVHGVNPEFFANGVVTGNGFDATTGVMSFTTQDSDTTVSFSSTTVVPLPAGLLLMGTALAGLGVAGRRKSKQKKAA